MVYNPFNDKCILCIYEYKNYGLISVSKFVLFMFLKTIYILNLIYDPSYTQYHWQVAVPKEVRLVPRSDLQQAAAPEDNVASRPPSPPCVGGEDGSGECLTQVMC